MRPGGSRARLTSVGENADANLIANRAQGRHERMWSPGRATRSSPNRALHRRPELIVPGVEELLRFESSVQFWPTRTAVEDIEIARTTIPKGSPLIPLYGSGNRDPNRFTNPDQVDLEREDNEHLGYSGGIHLCFGGPLARLEAQIAVGEFVRRVRNPRLVVDPPPYRHNQIFRGPRHVHGYRRPKRPSGASSSRYHRQGDIRTSRRTVSKPDRLSTTLRKLDDGGSG